MRKFFRIRKPLLGLGMLLGASGLGNDALAQLPVESPHGDFRGDCATCHAPESWTPARISDRFDHSQFGYSLDGAHAGVPCLLCHLTLDFAETQGTACRDCHDDVHAGEFGSECATCHSTRSFIDRADDVRSHRTTRFPLTGVHLTLDCADCHSRAGGTVAMSFLNTPTDCFACHDTDFRNARNPVHTPGVFPTDCRQCHSTLTWGAGTFDHALTGFPLTGAHRPLDCAECHGGNGTPVQFAGTPKDCFACHAVDYEQADNPVHSLPTFGTDCIACHNTVTWGTGDFDHSLTAFPLTGSHRPLDCAACHSGGTFSGTPTDCFACHAADYDGATDPVHALPAFPTNCAACHDTNAWDGAVFDHDLTAFPLTGAHVPLDCTGCHTNGQYTGTPTDCFTCHSADYSGAADPVHSLPSFPTDCLACHTTATWQGAVFDHDLTAFPLTGSHVPLDCASCHSNGQYAGTPTDCFACHSADYNGTTNPNHAASGFGTDCASCHGTSTWLGATFNHDAFFPIDSGKHRDVWGNDCTTCHTVPNDYRVFECILCHEHRQSTTDNDHSEVNGYSYNSNACYNCHPRGN